MVTHIFLPIKIMKNKKVFLVLSFKLTFLVISTLESLKINDYTDTDMNTNESSQKHKRYRKDHIIN